MEQKFKRGNKVKVLVGSFYWHPDGKGGVATTDLDPDQIGKEAVIIGSYADIFPFHYPEDRRHIYKIIFCETGNTLAWKQETDLEFIEDGGENLIQQARSVYRSKNGNQ